MGVESYHEWIYNLNHHHTSAPAHTQTLTHSSRRREEAQCLLISGWTSITCTINCSLRRSGSDHHPTSGGDQCRDERVEEGGRRRWKRYKVLFFIQGRREMFQTRRRAVLTGTISQHGYLLCLIWYIYLLQSHLSTQFRCLFTPAAE